MRMVIALGGNALLRRGQPMTEQNQRENVKAAARALAGVAREHTLVITHGNAGRSAGAANSRVQRTPVGSNGTTVPPYRTFLYLLNTAPYLLTKGQKGQQHGAKRLMKFEHYEPGVGQCC